MKTHGSMALALVLLANANASHATTDSWFNWTSNWFSIEDGKDDAKDDAKTEGQYDWGGNWLTWFGDSKLDDIDGKSDAKDDGKYDWKDEAEDYHADWNREWTDLKEDGKFDAKDDGKDDAKDDSKWDNYLTHEHDDKSDCAKTDTCTETTETPQDAQGPAAVPVPPTLALLGGALVAAGVAARRRKSK